MIEEKYAIIKYQGNQINIFSDGKNDYVNITEMAIAWKGRKSIKTWLKNRSTIEFLAVWEKKYNPKYDGTEIGTVLKVAANRNLTLSIKYWIEKTNAIGIFTKSGTYAGTYAHKSIAMRFAAYLSAEFELFLTEEFQRLKGAEESKEHLTHPEVLVLIQLKEVFKYVTHQTKIEDAHAEVFAAQSSSDSPYAEFHVWINKMLELDPKIIDERIKQYCIENRIEISKKLLKKPKREKVLMLDSYEALRNAVWHFFSIKGEPNAMSLANLVREMIKTEKGEILRTNEDDLFHKKQDLGEYNDFDKKIAEIPIVQAARDMLEYRANRPKQITQ